MRCYLLLFSLFLATTLSAQFQIGHSTVTFNDPARSNRPILTDIYYPADAAGNDVPLATGEFPVIQFGHGFVMSTDSYQYFWETYVSQGFILCLPQTEGSFSPSHTDFAKDLAFLCTAMEAENLQASSRFFGHIQPRYCIMGHSMGGGCTVLSYQYNPDLIKCVAAFAPANTNPSALVVAPALSVPSLVFGGSYDCIAPPAQQALPIYQALDTTACKHYVEITGASHCQFGDANANCSFGELLSGCSNPPISAAAQHALVNSILLPWLNVYLKEDESFTTPLNDLLASENGFSTLNGCSNTTKIDVIQDANFGFKILKNPVAQDELTIQMNADNAAGQTDFIICDLSGRALIQVENNANDLVRISISSLHAGLYYLVGTNKYCQKSTKKFVKI
ncbi:MAG: T9SS type A sorting domain-containing protein [Bacteroidota bacterium]|uniref:poly(ethylene terephthalate) hydrolase family protein n=1 Tax=Runella sp. TaxID=1960881 RepID=UPI0030199DB2